nr:protein IMPACT-like [Ciona intestinalis]|eukprot:XP_026693729.1 protein IMPACT-like [Ciona intestinalis]
MDNVTRQAEEIEAISAIYGEDWRVIDEYSRVFSFSVTESNQKLVFRLMLPPNYPSENAPEFTITAKYAKDSEIRELELKLKHIYNENVGECILFLWIEVVRDFFLEICAAQGTSDTPPCEDKACVTQSDVVPVIKHGEALTDRKSTFQGHLAEVHSANDVKLVISKLLKNRKIEHATHNISAYRIFDDEKSVFIQDCNDDGETAAGGRMLHLMQILNVRNVLVVVSRWYGGIQLGPDRFKHINNVTRSVLVQEGFVNDSNKVKKMKNK